MLHKKSDKKITDLRIDPPSIYLEKSAIHGMGVFAAKDFKIGDIIETLPLMPLSFRTNYQGDRIIYNYSYVNHSCECDECKKHGYVIYLPMGYGNLYNHQEKEQVNARINTYFDSFYAEVVAIRHIDKYSEIYLDYGLRYLFKDGKILRHEDNPR